MKDRGSPRRRHSYTEIFAALAALAAVFAPASLTGVETVDMVQRGLIAGFVTYVGAHGQRSAWLIAGALIAISAGGPSMGLVLVGLVIALASTRRVRRSRRYGAAAIGCYVNAIFWYPAHRPTWGVALAIVAMALMVASGRPQLRRPKRQAATTALATTAVLAVVACVLVGVAALLAGSAVRSGGDAARHALEAARDGDGERAGQLLDQAGADFDRASGHLGGVLAMPARFVPGVAQQLDAVRTTVGQGQLVAEAGDDLVAAADYDRLQYQGRLNLDLVEQLIEPTQRADVALATAAHELERVTSGTLLPPLRSRVTALADEIEEARRDTEMARALVTTAPQLFGKDAERHYLVIFLTPAELRGAGGFIGSYAELSAVEGKVELVRSGRIDDLIAAAPKGTRTISGPADYLARYGGFRPQDFLQDVTFSPHFPSSAQVIAELYPQSGGIPVDGVIGVDPTGLAALLELTGPVSVDGLDEELSADSAVELLTRRQYLEFGTRAERGEILAAATAATFDRLISASLPAPRELANVLSGPTRSGHLRLWSPDSTEQQLFERLGADGSLAIPSGEDGFAVVQQNSGNNKIDAYLKRDITYRAKLDARTGSLQASLRVELHNEVPHLDLPSAVVGNPRGVPKGTNLAWLTIFTPHVVTSATVDGRPIVLGPSSERGLNAFDTPQFQIPPGGSVVLEVQLEGSVAIHDGYALTILPQPVAQPDRFEAILEVDGSNGKRSKGPSTDLVDGLITAPTRAHKPIERTDGD